jgi:hypothetical protein
LLKVDQINLPRHCGAKPATAVDDLWAMLRRQDAPNACRNRHYPATGARREIGKGAYTTESVNKKQRIG